MLLLCAYFIQGPIKYTILLLVFMHVYLFFLFNRYNLLLVHCDILNFQTKNYFKYEENFYRIIMCWVGFLSRIFKVVRHFLRVWAGSQKFHVHEPKFEMSSSKQFEVHFIIFGFTPTLISDLQLFLLPLQMYHFGSTKTTYKFK